VFGGSFFCHSKTFGRLESVMFCVKKNREERNILDVSEEDFTSIFRTICKDFRILVMIKDGYI
jgi:hypothetical protein